MEEDTPVNEEAPSTCGRSATEARFGGKFQTDGYVRSDLVLGGLVCECVDFGETHKLSTVLKKMLGVGEEVETKKYTTVALSAGVEWASHGATEKVSVSTTHRRAF